MHSHTIFYRKNWAARVVGVLTIISLITFTALPLATASAQQGGNSGDNSPHNQNNNNNNDDNQGNPHDNNGDGNSHGDHNGDNQGDHDNNNNDNHQGDNGNDNKDHGNNGDHNPNDDHDNHHGDDHGGGDDHHDDDVCPNIDGYQKTVPDSDQLVDGQCVPVPTTATVDATKVICDDESDLPNWGSGGPDVTATTASDWVAQSDGHCRLADDWNFEWAPSDAGNPGDNAIGDAGSPWTEFSMSSPATVPAGAALWVREEPQDGYIPFSGSVSSPYDDVSAEFYCDSDVLNYDNYDRIDSVQAGQTYNCVGFNVPVESPQQCVDEPNGSWADAVVDSSQGTRKDGSAVLAARSNPDDALGASDWTSGGSNGFYSLGFGGSITLSFDSYVPDVTGPDLSIHEATNGVYPLEKATVEVSQDGSTWELAGTADNTSASKVTDIDFSSTGLAWIKYVRITDTSDTSLFTTNDADGFDLDAVEATQQVCDEPQPQPLQCDPSVNLLENGGFEAPALTSGSWDIIKDINLDPSSVLGWLVSWVTPHDDGRLGLEIQNHVVGDPAEGNQLAELDGDHPVTIWQNIATIPGKEYQLSFKYSPRPGRDAADSSIQVKVDDSVLGADLSTDGTSNTNTVWEPITRTFVADNSISKIEFYDNGTDTSYGGYLDAISLNCMGDPTTHEPTDGAVHIFKFVDGVQATSNAVNGVSFPMFTPTYNAPFTLNPNGWNSATPDQPYEASTNTITAGSTYSTYEDTTSNLVGTSCDDGKPYALEGYTTGSTLEAAESATMTTDTPSVTIDGNQYIIVWNKTCGGGSQPSLLKVHIYKYLDNGEMTSQVSDDSGAPAFPMTATWQTANLNGGVSTSGDYVLGNNHGGAALKYAADTSPMQAPADYTTSEITDGSVVEPIDSQSCPEGKYQLEGYKSSLTSLSDAESAALTATAPNFSGLTADAYVIVVNKPCGQPTPPATGTIQITKYTCPAGTQINRDDNGPSRTDINDADYTIPNGCVPESGASFGYTYDANNSTNDTGPYLGLNGDQTPFTHFGPTNQSGVTTLTDAATAGRYIIAELDSNGNQLPSSDMLGLYCYGDGDANPTDNDNQEITFSVANEVSHCVAYNKMASITVVKDTVGGNGSFHFSGLGGDEGFDLATTEGSAQETFDVPAAVSGTSYTISEGDTSGWDFSGASCVYDDASVGQAVEQGEQVTVHPGDEVTCTFTNTKQQSEPNNTEETIVVKDADLATNLTDVGNDPTKWFFYNDENDQIDDSLGSFVDGPATAPLGNGSAQISVTGNERRNLATYQFAGVKLSDITTLKFSTYNPSAGNGGSANRSAYINFNVDFDGTDLWQKRLAFVPDQNGTVIQNSWQAWDAINSGNALWCWSGMTGCGGSASSWPTQTGTPFANSSAQYQTWSDILAAYPNIRVRVSDPWFGMRVGEPYPDGYTEDIDAFVIGIDSGSGTDTKTFDFEPTDEQKTVDTVLPQCSDDIDNDHDGKIDSADPGCHTDGNAHNPDSYNPDDNKERSGGTTFGSFGFAGGGQVLGESTCSAYLTDFIKFGGNNDKDNVSRLQQFLNTYLGLHLVVDGIFGKDSFNAVKQFQLKEKDNVLSPWVGITLKNNNQATGWVYKTTRHRINEIQCPTLNEPAPTLTIDA
ncbi:MAG TPA: peptidoglycan-binding domain-containing protein [Candidatus Paceibacterota bacterium]|nr:peptidoglycan-binding domain-containing protein [Candidatus Paceibacterota bacterium]